MKVHYYIALAALRTGTSLDRWQNITMTMIEKVPGCPRTNKLQVIHLFKADYNLLLKIIWARILVWNAHDAGKLNDGQAGSRPGQTAIEVVVQKVRNGNNAKSCYDRIICNLTMIISQYYGLSSNITKRQATTLKKCDISSEQH
jgi:hypothetical protein